MGRVSGELFYGKGCGFSNINIDLMSAIPEQTYADWEKNLRTVAGLSPEHISAYSLIIEEGTPFGERKLKLPDEDTEYRMYENTAGILEEYGVSSVPRSPIMRKADGSRHNKGYWQRIDLSGTGTWGVFTSESYAFFQYCGYEGIYWKQCVSG